MDTVGVGRKEEEQSGTVVMVKLGKKWLYLQCCNTSGTVSIPQLFPCSCRLSLMPSGNALVLEFKERFSSKPFPSSDKHGQEQTLTIVVVEKVGVRAASRANSSAGARYQC